MNKQIMDRILLYVTVFGCLLVLKVYVLDTQQPKKPVSPEQTPIEKPVLNTIQPIPEKNE